MIVAQMDIFLFVVTFLLFCVEAQAFTEYSFALYGRKRFFIVQVGEKRVTNLPRMKKRRRCSKGSFSTSLSLPYLFFSLWVSVKYTATMERIGGRRS